MTKAIALGLLLVSLTACSGDGDASAERRSDPATVDDVERAFAAEGLDLFASTVDGRDELLPMDGSPFVVVVLATEREADRSLALVNDSGMAGRNLFNRSRKNVLVYSEGGLSDDQKRRIMAALARIAPLPREHSSAVAEDRDPRELRARHARRQRELESLSRTVLATRPTVYCWDDEGWNEFSRFALADDDARGDEFAGFASPASFRIELPSWVCDTLARLPEEIEHVPAEDAAAALGALMHETHHLTAIALDEALTECLALQTLDDGAIALGLSSVWARRLTRIAWQKLYPELSSEYRSTDCRPGGAFDQEPETPEFP